jgi:hypothetical protein
VVVEVDSVVECSAELDEDPSAATAATRPSALRTVKNFIVVEKDEIPKTETSVLRRSNATDLAKTSVQRLTQRWRRRVYTVNGKGGETTVLTLSGTLYIKPAPTR